MFIFVLGVCLGSFLNAVIFRTHRDESVVKGRSKCLSCEEPIGYLDLIPIVSYLRLKGKCRNCKGVISWQYPVIELCTGILFLVFYFKYQFGIALPASYSLREMSLFLVRDWAFIIYLIIIFVYDLRYTYILDRFTIPAMIVAVLLNLWLGMPAWSLVMGGVVLGGFFLAQHLVSKGKWVGGGDIRMGLLMGFMLGLRDGLVALFLAYLIGAMVGLVLIWTKRASRNTQLAFGTFLSATTLLVLFMGEWIIDWYLAFFV